MRVLAKERRMTPYAAARAEVKSRVEGVRGSRINLVDMVVADL